METHETEAVRLVYMSPYQKNEILTKKVMAPKFRGSQGYMGITVEECV